MERTFVIIKPEAIGAGAVGEIIARFERAGLKMADAKMLTATPEMADRLYPDTEEQLAGMGRKTLASMSEREAVGLFGTGDPLEIGRTLVGWNRAHIASGPIMCMILEGEGAIQGVRRMMGHTDPARAERGTIRGDLAKDSILAANRERRATRNLVHAADSAARVEEEAAIFFGGG